MYIDNITNNNFKGKVWLSSFVKPDEKKFFNEILNYKIDGITNNELLHKKKFDLDIWSRNTRQTIHPKIKANAVINYIITKGYLRGKKNQNYNPLVIRIEDGIETNAIALRQHLTDTEDFIKKNYPTHYYGRFDALKQKLKVLFGKA